MSASSRLFDPGPKRETTRAILHRNVRTVAALRTVVSDLSAFSESDVSRDASGKFAPNASSASQVALQVPPMVFHPDDPVGEHLANQTLKANLMMRSLGWPGDADPIARLNSDLAMRSVRHEIRRRWPDATGVVFSRDHDSGDWAAEEVLGADGQPVVMDEFGQTRLYARDAEPGDTLDDRLQTASTLVVKSRLQDLGRPEAGDYKVDFETLDRELPGEDIEAYRSEVDAALQWHLHDVERTVARLRRDL